MSQSRCQDQIKFLITQQVKGPEADLVMSEELKGTLSSPDHFQNEFQIEKKKRQTESELTCIWTYNQADISEAQHTASGTI